MPDPLAHRQSARSSPAAAGNPKSTNRFSHTWLASVPVPFRKNYLVGIDIQQRDFEHYGRPSYLRGEWCDRGWWYYYLYAAAIKVPLALWLLAAWVAAWRIGNWPGTIAAMVVRSLRSPPRRMPVPFWPTIAFWTQWFCFTSPRQTAKFAVFFNLADS